MGWNQRFRVLIDDNATQFEPMRYEFACPRYRFRYFFLRKLHDHRDLFASSKNVLVLSQAQ